MRVGSDAFVPVVVDDERNSSIVSRSRATIVESTSASSGEMTRRSSVSVFEGAMCRSGMSSPVESRVYWTKLWWLSSFSSSMRRPVARSTSTAAQVQKPRCSSRVRSRRWPVCGSSAQIRAPACREVIERRSRWPAAVNSSPGATRWASASRSAVSRRRWSTVATRTGRIGIRSRVR